MTLPVVRPANPQPKPPSDEDSVTEPVTLAVRKPEPGCDIDFPALVSGEEIGFETNRAAIAPASEPLLRRISAALSSCESARFEIGGHTDNKGSERYNQVLSHDRAKAVVDYLGSVGTNIAEISAVGYGESVPIASNEDPEGRKRNRRIEFKAIP